MAKPEKLVMHVLITAVCAGLVACGGGSDRGSDPVTQATTPGAGSTTANAETTGTIQYSQYQATNTPMGDKAFATTTLSANTTFNAGSKQGRIQFPVLGGNQTVATNDAYANITWTGPLTSGAYRLNGNILMGCNAAAPTQNQATHVLVSSSLTRLKEGAIDELNGKTFDLIDCGTIMLAAGPTLTMSADGTMSLSAANYTFPKNEVFNLLNPEKYSGALINNNDAKNRGSYAGHAFRFNNNGVNRYAIVIQTNANSFNDVQRHHYMLAIQR